MDVIGGTYLETVIAPDSRQWAGSGLRAAAALVNRDDPPKLHTAVDDANLEEVDLVRQALGVREWHRVSRDEEIGFRYVTPISAPAVNGPNSRLTDDLEVVSEATVLMFGLVEAPAGRVSVEAETLVLDPQRPRDAEPLKLDGVDARRVIVVANTSEMRRLSDPGPTRAGPGGVDDLRDAAAAVLARHPTISGVVTKRGAAGCLVSQRDDLLSPRDASGDTGFQGFSHTLVGAHPTSRVWPIGSGDTFSAGLAHAIDSGADLVEAARLGSAAAAYWCSTRSSAVPTQILAGDFTMLPRPVTPSTPRVYLAGPFFSIGERWLVETVREELRSLGVSAWSPVHEVGPGGLEVAQKDLDGLNDCDVVLALLDRADPGTIFEVGWAVSQDIPVIGYASVLDPEGAKMMAGTSVEIHTDLSTACYRAAWAGMGMRVRPGWAT